MQSTTDASTAVDVAIEAEAVHMAKRIRRREELAFACGFVLYLALELIRLKYFSGLVSERSLRGWFIPFACLTWLLAMISSVSMQSTLKGHGVSNERSQLKESVVSLIERHDTEGLRLLRGIAMAGAIYAFVLGMAMSLGICIALSN